jgi:uncharacterized protein with beta-barrel porin domain
VGQDNNTVYSVNLDTGSYSAIAVLPTNLQDISLLSPKKAYVLGFDNNVYSVNLSNGDYQKVTPVPIQSTASFLSGISVVDSSTAYIANNTNNSIFSLNLTNGNFDVVATIPGNPGIYDITTATDTIVYVEGVNDNKIYRVNVENGSYETVTPTGVGYPSNPGIYGIKLANFAKAYTVGSNNNEVYVTDLTTGESSLVTTTAVGSPSQPELENFNINGNTGYTVGFGNNTVYGIDLTTGTWYPIATIAFSPSGINGLGLFLQMETAGLTGNNVTFANYINSYGPIDVIRSFALLEDGLAAALESAAPTRNAFTTYASQNAYLASSQALMDHERQERFHYKYCQSKDEAPSCCDTQPLTVWATPFGEYAKEKSQQQTPAFHLGVGGIVLGMDKMLESGNVVGFGGSYVFTHVHEEDDAGNSNINQGFITSYGSLHASEWYFDLAIWGGYYAARNQRNISFYGVDREAKATIKGWQLAPHFEVGYDGLWRKDHCISCWGLEPFLMTDWVANWERGFHEHGAGSFNMGQKKRFSSLLRSETGLRFHETFEFNGGRIVLREKGSYAYQKTFHTGKISAFLLDSSGSFTVNTLTAAQNLGVVELSMLFLPKHEKMPYLDLRYQGEFGSRYQSHQGMLELGKEF